MTERPAPEPAERRADLPRNRAGIIAGLEQLASEDPYNGFTGETCRQAAALLRAASPVGEPREPPAPEVEKALAVWNRFLYRTDNTLHQNAVRYLGGEEADELQAAYNTIAAAVRAGAPPTEDFEREQVALEIEQIAEGPFVSYPVQRALLEIVTRLRALSGGEGK